MAFLAASSVLGAVGHFANLGQLAEVGQSRLHQREQMQHARRAYRLDSRALRIDLLNAVKEDVRDHYDTYAGRIDTLLLVHTLLLTFALATLQFSDQYVPQAADVCPDCVEAQFPFLVKLWVYLIAAILILPFWSILMLLWCKLKLDGWLEQSVRRLNSELRLTLSSSAFNTTASLTEKTGYEELESVEEAIQRLGKFVCEHQDNFVEVWMGECSGMIRSCTTLLWSNVVVAVAITAGMFWMFVMNNLHEHRNCANNFLVIVAGGLVAPILYIVWRKVMGGCRRITTCYDQPVDEGMEPQYHSLSDSEDDDSPARQPRLAQRPPSFGDARPTWRSNLPAPETSPSRQPECVSPTPGYPYAADSRLSLAAGGRFPGSGPSLQAESPSLHRAPSFGEHPRRRSQRALSVPGRVQRRYGGAECVFENQDFNTISGRNWS